MSHKGVPGGDGGEPTTCAPDGPIEPGRSVVDAVECNTARFVDLAGDTVSVSPTYLVLKDGADRAVSLSRTEVCALPELQNGLAYFGESVDSVRVRTLPDRHENVREHVAALSRGERGDCFEFGGRRFCAEVVLG